MQDVLEDYFSHERSKGDGRSDNPTARGPVVRSPFSLNGG